MQKERTLDNAEVFTPYNIVQRMTRMFEFPEDNLDFFNQICVDGCCGEGALTTTKYDTVTVREIPILDRSGLLDLKLKRIPKDISNIEWIELSKIVLKSLYGYELNDDSLFIARVNILLDVIDFYKSNYDIEIDDNVICDWAEIISYNFFNMDGLTLCVPNKQIPAKFMNWDVNKMELFNGEEELW
jgi:type I restriction-modification system DNA methylase subunit